MLKIGDFVVLINPVKSMKHHKIVKLEEYDLEKDYIKLFRLATDEEIKLKRRS